MSASRYSHPTALSTATLKVGIRETMILSRFWSESDNEIDTEKGTETDQQWPLVETINRTICSESPTFIAKGCMGYRAFFLNGKSINKTIVIRVIEICIFSGGHSASSQSKYVGWNSRSIWICWKSTIGTLIVD